MPSVIDLDKTAATPRSRPGLRGDPVTEPNDDKAVGIVFDQSPKGNERVDEGSTVTIRVSAGADTVPMPNVVGQQETDARELLVSQGFTTMRDEADDDAPEGEVIGQDPAGHAGREEPLITLTVSAGPAQVAIPDVGGMTVAEAANVLGRADLVGSTPRRRPTRTEGKVIRTDPAVGTPVEEGTAVNLVVSSGPEEVTVPTSSASARTAPARRSSRAGSTSPWHRRPAPATPTRGEVTSQNRRRARRPPRGRRVTSSSGRSSDAGRGSCAGGRGRRR